MTRDGGGVFFSPATVSRYLADVPYRGRTASAYEERTDETALETGGPGTNELR